MHIQDQAPESRAPAHLLFNQGEQEADLSDIRFIDWPAFFVFWALAIIVFLQFFTRYVLNDSLAWTEEIARYVLVIVGFSGGIIATRKGTQIFLEFFYRFIPPNFGKLLAVAVEGINALFYGFMAWIGVELALQTKTKMASAPIPKSILYWGVSAALAIMAIYSLYWLVHKLRQQPSEVLQDISDHALPE